MIKNISLVDPKLKFIPGETVIIFDELQEYPDVATCLKSFNIDRRIDWLVDAGVVAECKCLGCPELPLKGNVEEGKFKLYYPDTGLLIAALDEEAQEDLRVNKNLGVYKGALYENFVAEAFLKQGLGLFYYKKDNSTLEEDFFVRSKSELLPVEVKSNDDRSKSLRSLIKNENYRDIKHGIKLGDFNVGCADGIYTFPYFCAFLIKAFVKSLDSDGIH